MTELPTRESFIVRVYRYDPEIDGKVTGLIEVLDGSGASTPFRDTVELGEIVERLVGKRLIRKGKAKA